LYGETEKKKKNCLSKTGQTWNLLTEKEKKATTVIPIRKPHSVGKAGEAGDRRKMKLAIKKEKKPSKRREKKRGEVHRFSEKGSLTGKGQVGKEASWT